MNSAHDLFPWWLATQLTDSQREIVQRELGQRDERIAELVAEVNSLNEGQS